MQVNQLVAVVEGNAEYNVSAGMILAEWHSLSMTAVQYGQFLEQFVNEMNKDVFSSLIPPNVTVNWPEILIQR